MLVPVPAEVVTAMVPVALAPVTAVIVVLLFTVKDAAAVPPIVTAVAARKLLPVIVIVPPAGPDVGVKEDITGSIFSVDPLTAVPPGVVT
jgi:hypothetical protein